MSTMGKLQIMLLFLVAVFSGCSETDERAYVGKNSIYIRTEGDPVILAMDDEPLKATLMLIRAYDKDVSFEIDVKYLTEGVEDLVTVNPAVVTIPAGEKSVDFEIISNEKGVFYIIKHYTLEFWPNTFNCLTYSSLTGDNFAFFNVT